MILIIGLGNIDSKYSQTRHNVGQETIKKFAEDFNFPSFKLNKRAKAKISKKDNIILAQPTTYMNESGLATKLLFKMYKLKIENLFIIHDDIDLPLGKIKISKNISSAGHKGVQSIINELKTKKFIRFRIGIGDNSVTKQSNKTKSIDKFVLGKFTKKEKNIIDKMIKLTSQAIAFTLDNGIEKAMSKYNSMFKHV